MAAVLGPFYGNENDIVRHSVGCFLYYPTSSGSITAQTNNPPYYGQTSDNSWQNSSESGSNSSDYAEFGSISDANTVVRIVTGWQFSKSSLYQYLGIATQYNITKVTVTWCLRSSAAVSSLHLPSSGYSPGGSYGRASRGAVLGLPNSDQNDVGTVLSTTPSEPSDAVPNSTNVSHVTVSISDRTVIENNLYNTEGFFTSIDLSNEGTSGNFTPYVFYVAISFETDAPVPLDVTIHHTSTGQSANWTDVNNMDTDSTNYAQQSLSRNTTVSSTIRFNPSRASLNIPDEAIITGLSAGIRLLASGSNVTFYNAPRLSFGIPSTSTSTYTLSTTLYNPVTSNATVPTTATTYTYTSGDAATDFDRLISSPGLAWAIAVRSTQSGTRYLRVQYAYVRVDYAMPEEQGSPINIVYIMPDGTEKFIVERYYAASASQVRQLTAKYKMRNSLIKIYDTQS
jgi:hypothetical protein